MNKSVPIGTLTEAIAAAKVLILAAVLFLWMSSSYATQASAPFKVLISLNTANGNSNSGLCRSSSRIGTFGEVVTVECSTGKVVTFSGNTNNQPWTTTQDGSYRFLTQLSETPLSLGTLDIYAGGGTVTSWRIVHLANREYLELMIGW